MIDSAKQTAGIAAIQGVLGRSAVVRDKKSLASFPEGARPAAIVYPENVEQIGRILAAAQGAGASVQPVCNGDSPSGKKVIPGAIVIDMKRMNKVLEVNSDLAYCLVEPGVTYRQLA